MRLISAGSGPSSVLGEVKCVGLLEQVRQKQVEPAIIVEIGNNDTHAGLGDAVTIEA